METQIRLLILEDNPADAELAEYTLRSAGIGIVSRVVETRSEYIRALEEFSPDIILSDYDLPQFSGALAQELAREKRPEVPFILFTGAMGEERAIEILTAGATDYVMKNRLSRLVPAVERALKEAAEHRKRKAAEAERDSLLQELEMKVQERTAQLQMEINERKRTEEALSASRGVALSTAAFLKSTLDAAPAIIWTAHDCECRKITGNRAAYEFSRVQDGTNLSKTGPAPELLSSYRVFQGAVELQPEEMPIQVAARTGREIRNFAMDFHFDDGSIRSVIGDVVPVLDEQGRPAGAISAFLDITGRKQAEDMLMWTKRRDELVADVASRLLTSEEPQKIADSLFQKAMEFLQCDVFFNYLADNRLNRLHLNAYCGIPAGEASKIEFLDYGVAVCGCAARDAVRLIMEDIPATPDIRTDLVKSYGVKAYACHPLIVEGRVLGTISFGTRSRTRFLARELEVMKAVADFVAIAMHRLIVTSALKESEARHRQIFEEMSKRRD